MFSSRRYQRVSQHVVDSESDSDEATIFTAENGSAQKGEWHFGVKAYDLNQDLELPRIRPIHPSKRSKDNLRGYTRKQALFGACVFIVIVTVITTLAVLILMKQGYSDVSHAPSNDLSTTASSSDELPTDEITVATNEECNKVPKPLVNIVGTDVGQQSPSSAPCGTRKTTEQQIPTTQPSEAVSTEPSPSEKTTMSSPSQGATETKVQLPTSAETKQQMITTQSEAPTSSSEALPTTLPANQGEVMKGTTPQSTEELSTTTTDIQDHVTTTTSLDQQLLKNWSEKIKQEISETTTQQSTTHSESTESTLTPPTTIMTPPATTHVTTSPTLTPPTTMLTPPTTTHEATSPNDMTSEPIVNVAPTVASQGIDWEQDFFPAMSESTIELFDINGDGIMDVVTVEDFSQCTVRVIAMDGRTGTKFWQKEVNFPAFGVRCELDVNGDGVKDCLVTGRGAGFAAIDSRNGSLLWEVDPSITFPPYNFYFPLIIEDLNNDGVSDLINMHGGDVSYKPDEQVRSPGYLVVVSGKTGQSLMPPILTPDGHESYMSPVLFKLNGKDDLVLFGSGGETVSGSLWAVSLASIRNQIMLSRARQSWKEGGVYRPFVNDTHHPCFMKGTDFNKIRPTFDHKAFDFERPIFVSSAAGGMRFCPRWEDVSPIWNKYGVCLYELYKSESKGVMVPPVLVDLTLDGIDDLVVSTFDGHTAALNGSDASTRLWDIHYPNTESYSVPAPLYYNQDSIPDLLIRSNYGEWNEYNVSTLRLLDGRNGAELWSFDSAHTGMMSSLSIASKSTGSDAMLFMTIGKLDSGSDQSDTDSNKWQRVRRHEHNPANADIGGNPDPNGIEGESELMEDDDHDANEGGVDYDDDFMNRAMSNHDPPDLWISTPNDQFPDPKVDVEGFMVYCGESFHRLTAYLWLVTREMIEKGVELKPIAVHEPFLFTLPEGPPPDNFPPDGSDGPPPGENFNVSKRHGDTDNPDPVGFTQNKKMMRCSHISAPLQVIASPAVGDFDSDGRLDVAYSVVWSSISPGGLGTVPELKVFAFTLEERYRQVMGVGEEVKDQNVVDFNSFLPANQQPWNRYMGRHGNSVYQRG